MLDWDNVRYFLQVVRAGSLSKAAKDLGVNQTTVSRRIAALEQHFETSLFERSGKQWLITPIGERLTETAERMADDANILERKVMADSQDLKGLLRITVADVCTQYLILPVVQAFVEQYPDIDLEIIATHDELNLAAREADIALRTTDTPPPNLIGKRIGRLGYAIYGTQKLLQRVQSNPDDCDIPCITWVGDGHTRAPWIEKSFPNTQRVYRSTELGIMLRMVNLGLGIAQMPCVFADQDPLLFRIPAKHIEPGWGLWVLSHVDLRTTARVRIFRDFLIQELVKRKDQIEGYAVHSD